jgi:hypothetical protein
MQGAPMPNLIGALRPRTLHGLLRRKASSQ